MPTKKKTVKGTGLPGGGEVGAGTDLALVETKEEHRGEYAMIRQMGGLPAESWPDSRILAVRQLHGGSAQNTAQLAVFLGIAHKHGLDPALNEIQLIQTNKGPKAYAGRDGFLKSASAQPHMYGGISSGVVYPQDDFHVEVVGNDIQVHHKWSPTERKGRPHGAYCIVWDAQGHPTYVYRETLKCQNMKSFYWKDESVDDAIQNRAIAGCLRRVVPLGGILIHGEEPLGSLNAMEKAVAGGTKRRLQDIKAKLGLEAEEVSVDADGNPDPEDIDQLLDEYAEKYGVTPDAFIAWARACGSVPDDLEVWTTDHKTFALHAMADTEGMEFQKELAASLAAGQPDSLEILTDIANCSSREELDKLVEALWDRRKA